MTEPEIKKTKSGKHYFVVNGRKVYINSKMTKKQISGIYKLLVKNLKVKIKKRKVANKATATIKQYFNGKQYEDSSSRAKTPAEKKEKEDKQKSKPLKSTIDEKNRVSSSQGRIAPTIILPPKDSGNKDLINNLINKNNILMDRLSQPYFISGKKDEPTKNIDYSERGRYITMLQDDEYNNVKQRYPNVSHNEINNVLKRFDLLHLLPSQQLNSNVDEARILEDIKRQDQNRMDQQAHVDQLERELDRQSQENQENKQGSFARVKQLLQKRREKRSKSNQSIIEPIIQPIIQDQPSVDQTPKVTGKIFWDKEGNRVFYDDQGNRIPRHHLPVYDDEDDPASFDFHNESMPDIAEIRRQEQEDAEAEDEEEEEKKHNEPEQVQPQIQPQIQPQVSQPISQIEQKLELEKKEPLPHLDPKTVSFAILSQISQQLHTINPNITPIGLSARAAQKDLDKARKKFTKEITKNYKKDNQHIIDTIYDSVSRKHLARYQRVRPRSQDPSNVQINILEDLMKNKSNELVDFSGEGKESSNNGLYNDEIDKIMSKFSDYKGTIMRDQIKKLLPHIKPQSRLAFIINTDTHNKLGMHWDAVYIDGRSGSESSNSLEWFDSFGRPMPADILEDCKIILKMLKPETILKVKENHVVHQKDSTSNCGWFACKFLIDRFRGKTFAEASGYDDRVKINDSKEDEAEIERLKSKPPFNYIY